MSKITNIILHCSAGEWGCCRAIRDWHMAKGWRDIGYHFVIMNGFPTYEDFKNNSRFENLDGQIECGRYLNSSLFMDDNEEGSQCLGYNRKSIGVCYVGNAATASQEKSIMLLCNELVRKYQLTYDAVLGHCETESGKKQGKTCPNLDMNKIRNLIRNMNG